MPILRTLEKIYRATPTAFGLEISDTAIRIAQLRPRGGSLTLTSFGRRALEANVVQNGAIIDAAKLQAAVRQAMADVKGERLRGRYVVASLPEPQSFLRIVQLPKLAAAEIPEAIRWEIETNIPLPLTEVYYDWGVVPTLPASENHLDVLVAAVPRSVADGYIAVFEALRLKTAALEVDALSVSRSVIRGENSPEAVLIIDLTTHRTTFMIFAGSSLRFTSSVPLTGMQLDAAIAKELGVGEEEAARLKMAEGLTAGSQGGKMLAAAGSFLRELEEKARQYIEFFQTHAQHAHLAYADIKRIVVCGDQAAIPHLPTVLSKNFRIPVELANPWVNILTPPLQEVPLLPYRESLSYTTALGLALRGYRECR